jgi:hypothetical protein
MCPPEAFHCSSLHPGLACVQDVEECGRSVVYAVGLQHHLGWLAPLVVVDLKLC